MRAWKHPSAYAVSHTLSKPTRIAVGRWLMLVSEGIASLRRFALLVRWLFSGSAHLLRKLRHVAVVDEEAPSLTARLATLSDVLGHVSESLNMLALFSGSGLFWMALGWRREPKGWVQRRRQGLERVGVYVSLAHVTLDLYLYTRRNEEIALDMGKSAQLMQTQLAQFDTQGKGGHVDPSVSLTVQSEYVRYLRNRRRLRWLRVERACLLCDGSFTLLEVYAPDREKDVFEATTGMITAVLQLLRGWNEARFGSLE